MRAKRYKRANKILTFFKYNYKLNAPFKVLVDGTFCMAALNNKINLKEQLPKYLGGDTEIFTTRCILKELEEIGHPVYGALSICRHFEVTHCPHTPAKAANECLMRFARKMRTGGTKFFMATQDDVLTEKLRNIPGVPILYIKYNAILIDKPSEVSIKGAEGLTPDLQKVADLKKEVFGETEVQKKKKKIKGANPLSCKKKKMKVVEAKKEDSGAKTSTGKRRRKKKAEPNTSSTLAAPASSES